MSLRTLSPAAAFAASLAPVSPREAFVGLAWRERSEASFCSPAWLELMRHVGAGSVFGLHFPFFVGYRS
jgi:hypothetical protein